MQRAADSSHHVHLSNSGALASFLQGGFSSTEIRLAKTA
jgi:hypothetical protein